MNTDLKILVLDLETDNLDENAGVPLEIGVIGLDAHLNEIFRRETPIALPPYLSLTDLLATMPEEVVLMHSENGLISDLHHGSFVSANPLVDKRDEDGNLLLPTVEEADEALAELIDAYSIEKVILAGSGVSHFDQRWLKKHFPYAECRLWHGTLDVGIFRRHYEFLTGGNLVDANDKKTHRALQDVECHLEELIAFSALFIRDHIAREQILQFADNFGVVTESSMTNPEEEYAL